MSTLIDLFHNGALFLGFWCGILIFSHCWIPLFNDMKGYAHHMVFWGISLVTLTSVMRFVGLCNSPGIMFVSIILDILIIPIAVWALFLPTVIAYREHRTKREGLFPVILFANWLFFVPLVWLIALVVVTAPDDLYKKLEARWFGMEQ